MRTHVVAIAGLCLWASTSHATPPLSPEETVQQVIHTQRCIPPMPGDAPDPLEEAIRRDPAPYLPFLKAEVSLERIKAAPDSVELMILENALLTLIRLGGHEGREFSAAHWKQLHHTRDGLYAQIKRRAPRPGTHLSPRAQQSFQELTGYTGRITDMELTLLRGFTRESDPRLRDAVLLRLDQESNPVVYNACIEYLHASCREDSLVQARLKQLLETSDSLSTRQALQRFFAE